MRLKANVFLMDFGSTIEIDVIINTDYVSTIISKAIRKKYSTTKLGRNGKGWKNKI